MFSEQCLPRSPGESRNWRAIVKRSPSTPRSMFRCNSANQNGRWLQCSPSIQRTRIQKNRRTRRESEMTFNVTTNTQPPNGWLHILEKRRSGRISAIRRFSDLAPVTECIELISAVCEQTIRASKATVLEHNFSSGHLDALKSLQVLERGDTSVRYAFERSGC